MAKLKLIAELGLNKTGFDAGMASAGKQVNKFGSDLKSALAGSFSAAAFLALTNATIEAANAVNDLAERLQIGQQEAQEFALAAKLGGADVAFFAKKFEHMRGVLREAQQAGKNPLSAFGIEFTGDPAKAVRELARAIEQSGVNAAQSAQLVELFGQGAGKMIGVLADLRNANSGTLFFSDDDIASLRDADDLWNKIANNVKVVWAKLINPRYGPLTQILAKMGIDPFGVNQKDSNPEIDNEAVAQKEKESRIAELVQRRIIRLEEEAFQLRRRNIEATTGAEERLNQLYKEREGIFARVATTAEERAMKERDMLKNEADIIALSKQPEQSEKAADSEKVRQSHSISETAFGRIGAFTGAAAGAAVPQLLQQQVNHLNAVRDALVSRGITVRDVR